MVEIDGLPSVKEMLERSRFVPRRAWGQNFLFDLNLANRIASAAGKLDGQTVIEVGAGLGGLTRAILFAAASQVIAIERDPRCAPALQEIALHYPGRLRVIIGDAMKQDFSVFSDRPVKLIANLPYQIATALLLKWLQSKVWPPWWSGAVLMFQKEVAERITATSSNKAYGRLSVLVSWLTRAVIICEVEPYMFMPVPKVSSAVVRFSPRVSPLACDRGLLEKVTSVAFRQRRKMLRSSLKPLLKYLSSGQSVDNLCKHAWIDSSLRAENLSIEDFVRLVNVLSA